METTIERNQQIRLKTLQINLFSSNVLQKLLNFMSRTVSSLKFSLVALLPPCPIEGKGLQYNTCDIMSLTIFSSIPLKP